MAQGINERMDGIEIFDILLCPYADDEYRNSLKEPQTNLLNQKALSKSMKDRDKLVEEATMEFFYAKFRGLMKLADRNGLLLDKTSDDEEWNLEEENATNTAADVAETTAIN